MKDTEPKPIHDIYDDLTADFDAVNEYAAEFPSFEQFRIIYVRMVVNFTKNAKLGNWEITEQPKIALGMTTDDLRDIWIHQISSWADVETYMEDWIEASLNYSEASDRS